MSLSYSDCYSDLLCAEESDILCGADQSECTTEECSYEYEHFPDFDDSIAEFIEQERKFVPGIDYVERFHSQALDASARGESVAWILKSNGWPLQLLAVACLSLAAKMEEPLVPSIIDLQVEGAKYIFEPRTIRRMEFLVLSVLDWRLRSITPFSFIGFFAHKIDPTGTYTGFLISRATQIILSNVQEASLLEYWPSCIAAATILCAASDLSNFSLINAEHAESWCDGLSKEKITKCYRLVQGMSPLNRSITKFSKIVPVQVRVMTRTSTESGDSSSSSSSPSSYKRRKLNNSSWVDDDKRSSSS
ncbi:cyclin-D1-1 [Tanacetum coccineum]